MSIDVLIIDATPGLGGALTSVAALVPVLAAHGLDAAVAAVLPEAAHAAGINAGIYGYGPTAFDAIHGPAWAARETARAASLVQLAARLRPRVVLANNAPGDNAAAYAAARAMGVPIAQYLRARPGEGRTAAALLSAADHVFAVGAEAHAAAAAARPRGVTRVAEGLDPARPVTPRVPASGAWLWAASSAAWKGWDLFRDAVSRIETLVPPINVCVAPTAGSDSVLPAAAPGVVLHAPERLDAVRAHSLVHVHTALLPEPFGRAVLESAAAGLCPIVPDEGGPAEWIAHERNGLLYRARSAESLAAVLAHVARHPGDAAALGARAAESARAFDAFGVFGPVAHTLRRLAYGPDNNGARRHAA